MDLKHLDSKQILSLIFKTVMNERRLTIQVLRLLLEVDRRKLYAQEGFSSLFGFCVQVLGYSKGAAVRRIRSMRLLRDLPEVEEALQEGRVSLSTLSVMQRFLQNEPREFSIEEKREFFQQIQGKSKSDCERFFITKSLHPIRAHEREKIVSNDLTEIRFLATQALMEKLQKIRNRSAHRNPNPSYAELIEWMADITLAKVEKASGKGSPENPRPDEHPETPPNPRQIPLALKRRIWKRDQGKCQYVNPKSGRKCGSEFGPEIDHIHAVFEGGSNEPDNLELICKAHNLLRARQKLGDAWMDRYTHNKKKQPPPRNADHSRKQRH